MWEWQEILSKLDYAFQPIVNIHSGAVYGFEALLRGCDRLGFASIDAFFEEAYLDGQLDMVERALREKAIRKYTAAGWQKKALLFYNLDNRLLDCESMDSKDISVLVEKYGMDNQLCFEISEKHQIKFDGCAIRVLQHYRSQGIRVAIDDYGTGYSGLQLLYYTEPHFIKIDRFFIQDIATDLKKKIFVSNLVNSAHLMGSLVVAEGVETKREYLECLEIGCDLVQGYYVQKPSLHMEELLEVYPMVSGMERRKINQRYSDKALILTELSYTKPVVVTSNTFEVFMMFQKDCSNFIPVVNQMGEPIGIVRESKFKRFAYARFGRELLQNQAYRGKLMDFVDELPVVDVHSSAEKILEIFNTNKQAPAILIADQMRYVGHLSAQSLLRVLHEKNLTIARDQNPLTRLPGNNVIFEFVAKTIKDASSRYALVYLDFDQFKPFNDRYGFRQGDRVILRFAEILREQGMAHLTAHIGGDDFFLGYQGTEIQQVLDHVRRCIHSFIQDVKMLYEPEDLAKGFICSKDRNGVAKDFPLMTVSAVVIDMPLLRSEPSHDHLSMIMARGKKLAKENQSHIHFEALELTSLFVA